MPYSAASWLIDFSSRRISCTIWALKLAEYCLGCVLILLSYHLLPPPRRGPNSWVHYRRVWRRCRVGQPVPCRRWGMGGCTSPAPIRSRGSAGSVVVQTRQHATRQSHLSARDGGTDQ